MTFWKIPNDMDGEHIRGQQGLGGGWGVGWGLVREAGLQRDGREGYEKCCIS